MDEYIERKKAVDAIADTMAKGFVEDRFILPQELQDLQDELEMLPSADVAPVVHGQWLYVHKGDWTTTVKCSECDRRVTVNSGGGNILNMYPYCHCGAKMDLSDG